MNQVLFYSKIFVSVITMYILLYFIQSSMDYTVANMMKFIDNMDFHLYLLINNIFGYMISAPLTEEVLKLWLIKLHFKYPKKGYLTLLIGVFVMEQILYIVMYWGEFGAWMIPSRSIAMVFHLTTIWILYKNPNMKGLLTTMILHSSGNGIFLYFE